MFSETVTSPVRPFKVNLKESAAELLDSGATYTLVADGTPGMLAKEAAASNRETTAVEGLAVEGMAIEGMAVEGIAVAIEGMAVAN